MTSSRLSFLPPAVYTFALLCLFIRTCRSRLIRCSSRRSCRLFCNSSTVSAWDARMVARSQGESSVFSSGQRKESPAWLSCRILKACRRTPNKPVKGHRSFHFCSPTKPVRTLICRRVSLRSSTLMSNSCIKKKKKDNDQQHKPLMLAYPTLQVKPW